MAYKFPPSSQKDFSKCLKRYENAPYRYISTPMTSGLKYLDFVAAVEDKNLLDEDKNAIWNVNIAQARFATYYVSRLFDDDKIINPTEFQDDPNTEGWTGNDFLAFWTIVLENCCSEIFFVDDWHYSMGCAWEFYVAQKNNIPCFDQYGNSISLDSGIRLIKTALVKYEYVEQCRCFLNEIYKTLTLLKVESELYAELACNKECEYGRS